MAFDNAVINGSAELGLENWTKGVSADQLRTSMESLNTDGSGSLEHLKIGNENFADAVSRRSGIDKRTVQAVAAATDRFFINNGYVDAGMEISGESLAPTVQQPVVGKYIRSRRLADISVESVQDLVESCLEGMPASRMQSTIREIGAVLSAKDPKGSTFESLRETPKNGLDIFDACGARAFSHYANPNAGMEGLNASLESFGATINQLNINQRLAVNVSILRNFSSTIDKLFLRVTDETNTVVMVIPSPVIFSLELMNNHKADVRNNPETEVSLVNIHAEPGIVNTAPQAVMPNINPANDTGATSVLDNDSVPGKTALRAIGQTMNLLDLTANQNRYGFENANHTDSIAEGGKVQSVILKASKSDGTAELFSIQVGGLPGARYITTANNSDSGDTIVTLMDLPFPITSGSTQTNGKPTALFASLGKANLLLKTTFTSNLRLKYCDIDGQGNVAPTAIPAAGVSADSAASDVAAAGKLLADVKFEIVSFIPELFFNEENLRKTTISSRVNWLQRSFQIPQGKNFTVDTALDQEKEEAPIETVQTAMSIGNSDRGMSVLESRMEETADMLASAKANPEIYRQNRLQNLSYAGTLCRPYVLRAEADYRNLSVSVMRESERLSDKHAKITQMFLNGLANVTTRSLYCTSMNPGERVVFKALMHSVTADLLFSIPAYHPTLSDAAPKANGADYSFVLNNGYRIDVVKTNFHNWQGKVAVVPVREDDPGSLLSFATIRDRGVFAGTVPGGVYNGSTVIRDVVNSREFVLVTNPIGMILNIENIDFDLGEIDIIDAV